MPVAFVTTWAIPNRHNHHTKTSSRHPFPPSIRARRTRACVPPPAPRASAQRDGSHTLNAEILSLALPALGALALDPLLSLIDTAFVGRLGVHALAGVGLSTLVLNVSFSIFNFLSISTTPLLAHALASPNATPPKRVLATSIQLALLLGLATSTLLLTFPRPLLTTLGATATSLPPATAYLRARTLATPLALASFVANGALRALRDLRTPFVVAAVANLLNITLDVLLIFRLSLGVTGAALATSISQAVAAIIMLTVLSRRDLLSPRDLLRPPHLPSLRALLSAGGLLALRTLSLLTTVAYATTTAAARGAASLAAYELTRQLWVLQATLLDAFAAAAQALVASAVATHARRRARRVADRTLLLAALAGATLAAAAAAAGRRLPALFTTSRAVVDEAARSIRMAAVCAPLNGAVFALDGVLAACADYRYMAGAIAAASAVACAALTVVRMRGGGVVAVWAGLNVLMIARAVVLFWRYAGPRSPIPAVDEHAE